MKTQWNPLNLLDAARRAWPAKCLLSICVLQLALGIAIDASGACVKITCPSDIVTGCQSTSGAVVNFAPDASTTCGTSIAVTCSPPSGSLFPIGTNLVQCAVNDPRGNMDRCAFRVIVLEECCLTLSCPTTVR